MPISPPTQLDFGFSASSPATTASISPAANRLLLVEVGVAKTGAPAPAESTIAVSGLGLTWQEVLTPGAAVLTQDYRSRRRLYWFVTETASAPTPGTLSITYSGAATLAGIGWSVQEIAGAVVGNNGQDAIGNIGNLAVGTGSNEISVTIGGTPGADDITIGMAGIEQAGGTPGASSPASAVELSNNEHADIRHLIVAYDPDASMAFTFGPWGSTANGAGAMGILVVAAAGGPATVNLVPAILDFAAPALSPVPGPVTVNLVPAVLDFVAPALDPEPGPVTVNLVPAVLDFVAAPLSPSGAGVVNLVPAILDFSAPPLSPTPGMVTVNLVPAILDFVAVPVTFGELEDFRILAVAGPASVTSPTPVGPATDLVVVGPDNSDVVSAGPSNSTIVTTGPERY